MGKRYYCDYCDRTLPYTVEAKKKHDSGHQHRIAKRLYYSSMKRPMERLKEELEKPKCRRFLSGRICSHGDACNYSHMTEAHLNALSKAAAEEIAKANNSRQVERKASIEYVKSLCAKSSSNSDEDIQQKINAYTPLTHLKDYSAIPPSLQPPKLDDFIGTNYATWG